MPDINISYFDSLFEKYRNKGVIIDANLMIYYFIGCYDINLLNSYKKTNVYKIQGFELISELIDSFKTIITTPHILTEISNLSTSLNENIKQEYLENYFEKIKIFDEHYLPATAIGSNVKIKKLGLTDSMILFLTKQ